MLRTRALSAAVLIPLVAGLTYAGGWLLAAALLVVSVRAAHELFQLMKEAGYKPSLQATTVVMGLLFKLVGFSLEKTRWISWAFSVLGIGAVMGLFGRRGLRVPVAMLLSLLLLGKFFVVMGRPPQNGMPSRARKRASW